MDPPFKSSNEEAMSEGKTEMPVLQEMINELRESAASTPQTSNTSLPAEDLLVKEALALPQLSETGLSTEETSHADDTDVSTEKTSETITEALNSSSKRFSIALNNAATSSSTDESEEQFTNVAPVDQTPVQQFTNVAPIDQTSIKHIDNIQPSLAQSSVQDTTPKKRQHIMISYNRSCEDGCRKIRNGLRKLKYIVWMDVYDMHDNFIDGMAKAIRNSYIVLMCINRKYDDSYWCKKEAEDIAIKRIKFIPCFMEEPFTLEDELDFLVGSNQWIDFSKEDKFDESFGKLIKEITYIEKKLATQPRETPPPTPGINPTNTIVPNPNIEIFDTIMRNFKTWVEDNRHNLKRFNRKQSAQLIDQLVLALLSDNKTPDDENKKQLLQQLLSSTSQNQHEFLPGLLDTIHTSNYPMMKGLLVIMGLWAVRVVFKKD